MPNVSEVCRLAHYLAKKHLVGAEGLEPSSLKTADFKSAVYANSTTPPYATSYSHMACLMR